MTDVNRQWQAHAWGVWLERKLEVPALRTGHADIKASL